MIIIGKSKAACSMIFDALKSNNHFLLSEVKIFNNLKLDGDIICESKKVKEVELLNDFEYVLGAVMPQTKRKLVNLYPQTYKLLFNKSAFISNSSKIGQGTVIGALAHIAGGVEIGKYVTVYTGAIIEHDCLLEDFVTLAPNVTVCGEVKIGEGTFIGAGSVIKNGVTIGKNCTIGCGSNVITDVADGVTIFGNPAKIIL